MLSKGVEREKEKMGISLTYYTGFQVVIYGNTDRGSNSIQRQGQDVGPGAVREKERGRSRPNEVPVRPCGGFSIEHDYVMRSRSRDRTSSTREPRAFHLTSGNALLNPNERSSPVRRQRVTRL